MDERHFARMWKRKRIRRQNNHTQSNGDRLCAGYYGQRKQAGREVLVRGLLFIHDR